MVDNVTSLTGNGLRDWLVQRVSAWVMTFYIVGMLGFILCHSPMPYEVWTHLFECEIVRISSVLFLLALCLHAWVGVWTVTTDYLNCVCVRLFVQVVFACTLIASFVWGVFIFWGI